MWGLIVFCLKFACIIYMWVKYIERPFFWKKKICREAKQHCNPKSLEESIAGIGKLKSIRCNCNGTKVSIMCDKVRRHEFSYFDSLPFCFLSNKRFTFFLSTLFGLTTWPHTRPMSSRHLWLIFISKIIWTLSRTSSMTWKIFFLVEVFRQKNLFLLLN